jgi:hypothetical protein
MKTQLISASALINAPAEQVYAILADYHNGHPLILPKPFFQSLEVEQGGVGAGTIIYVQMRVFGQTQSFRAAVTEPEPGRVLVETDLAGKVVTTFTVVPVEGGRQAQTTFTTELKTRGGLAGWLEGFLSKMFLQRVYAEELKLLAALAEQRAHKPVDESGA